MFVLPMGETKQSVAFLLCLKLLRPVLLDLLMLFCLPQSTRNACFPADDWIETLSLLFFLCMLGLALLRPKTKLTLWHYSQLTVAGKYRRSRHSVTCAKLQCLDLWLSSLLWFRLPDFLLR